MIVHGKNGGQSTFSLGINPTFLGGFNKMVQEIDRAPNFQIQPYTLEILLEAVALSSIRDPADRAIVATARHLGYPLITADEQIQEGGWVETVWD